MSHALAPSPTRHPATQTWVFPPPRDAAPDGCRRVNLRELSARPARFEHHLMVVGQLGGAQLELVTASEPLFFAHANVSDELVLALPTGDPMLDAFPFRTFLLDEATGALVGRVAHATGQLLLHPHGWLHWPGMLRAPYTPPAFPGPRRCGLSLVFCAATPTPPANFERLVGDGLDNNVKAYPSAHHGSAPPFHLIDVFREPEGRVLAEVAAARMQLWVSPGPSPVVGAGYVCVLEASRDSPFAACDLVYLDGPRALEGVRRALVFTAPEATPPPPSWDEVPTPLMLPFEDGAGLTLPLTVEGIELALVSDERVRVSIGASQRDVPRYWLARMLFRLALHGFSLGYLETYEGFFYDDRRAADSGYRLGLRDGEVVTVPRARIREAVERLYRAVAPPGYTERLR